VWCPPGTFTMGSSMAELRAEAAPGTKMALHTDEHKVTLTKGFWLGKHEVTQRQWQAVMGKNPSHFKKAGLDAPVEKVSWNDCQEFLKKLNAPVGHEYRLPTEAEWEYAARGGPLSKGFTYSGSNDADDVAWYHENSGDRRLDDAKWDFKKLLENKCRPHPVGQKKPNELGLYDMSGNVAEWCQDRYGKYASDAAVDPTGARPPAYTVLRGGSWYSDARYCRSGYRSRDGRPCSVGYLGFRVALGPQGGDAQVAKPPQGGGAQVAKPPQGGDTKTVDLGGGAKLELVWCPPGTFTMGSPKAEQGAMVAAGLKREWVAGETQHRVTLTKGFWLGKHEVTQRQWQSVMGKNPSHFQHAGLDAPVESVSWNDCQEFLKKLNAPVGHAYRLPTESEWEYACRAGTTTALYTGDIRVLGERNAPALDPIAWYGGNSGVTYEGGYDSSDWKEKQENHRRAGTQPVGKKRPNAWGLHDMIGNVWEWCQDSYGDYPSGTVADPSAARTGSVRVNRGGGWNVIAGRCRSAYRFRSSPSLPSSFLGFRVALGPVR
ncbi:MAG: formylglycine-generating enzyme family protein, partial [Victivallales bacterium]|nr:formylglycine-generating enzyme family protein [Victivallales bacterium]